MAQINFDENTHTYTTESGKKLISTTQLLALAGIGANYSAVDSELLKESSEKGIAIHKEIEEYLKTGETGFTDAVYSFVRYLHENKLKPIASERVVSDNFVAGTIDFVCEDINGNLILVDFKTTSVIHTESVSWQTSIYKYLWEKCDTRPISQLQVFHFGKGGKLVVKPIKAVSKAKVEELIKWYIADTEQKFAVSLLNDKQIALRQEAVEIIKQAESQLKKANETLEKIKAEIVVAMKENGLTHYEDDDLIISIVAPVEKMILDTKRLKEEKPKIYESYSKKSVSAEQIRLKIKE